MKKKVDAKFRDDLPNEGKEKAYLDVDRMINEGLSGGSVHEREEMANIEETIHLPKEDPPNK
ncbi:hypothetical protein JOC85_000722 [Bacillus mesophilus]|uniref:DUF4025 domain-containing protein n=1 Tax=Bacillus mesophilus TaxID=1808955 RepID=A0A6M0Q390_9BACI|nr:hypothetical protein [Bacillus mesophilus]MBM7659955.1 hypothetical protein [Bacillus mesophilus]NEY70816.1 hypothetical protein [Bacillus mesophilus]